MRLFDAHSASVLFADYIWVLTTSSYLSPQHCSCCFYGPVSRRCKCSPSQTERYMSKISGSLIDRINIHIVVPAATFSKLHSQLDWVLCNSFIYSILRAELKLCITQTPEHLGCRNLLLLPKLYKFAKMHLFGRKQKSINSSTFHTLFYFFSNLYE